MWRVILADDEAYVLTGLRTLIPWADFGCEIAAEASNGQELLNKVREAGADIVIMDIRMPVMNGLDAANALRRDHPEIVLIFLTGYEDFEFARAAVNVGAAAYIVKTDALEELPGAIAKAVKTLKKSRVSAEPPYKVALLRALSDGSFAMRRAEFAKAFDDMRAGFTACRLLAVELTKHVSRMELANLKLLLESSFVSFSPILFPMKDTRLCLLVSMSGAPIQQLYSECAALLPVAQGFCALRVVIAISAEFDALEGLQGAYEGVNRLLAARLRDDERAILLEDAMEARADAEPQLESLNKLLLKGGEGEFDAWLNGFIRSLRSRDMVSAHSECLAALSDMSMICLKYDKQLSPPGGRDFRADVITCETLKGLSEILEQAMRETTRLIRRENEKIHALVKAANEYIEVHACEKMSLADIANAVHANPSHLSRFYKEKTGRNLFDVVNQTRIDRAIELMLATDMKTYEIADAVGFSDTSNFSKFFKKRTGLSPREYARAKGDMN